MTVVYLLPYLYSVCVLLKLFLLAMFLQLFIFVQKFVQKSNSGSATTQLAGRNTADWDYVLCCSGSPLVISCLGQVMVIFCIFVFLYFCVMCIPDYILCMFCICYSISCVRASFYFSLTAGCVKSV